MKMKFNGKLAQLQANADQQGVQGTWEPEPNGVFMLRAECGANMHWASTTKSLWFDGPTRARQSLLNRLFPAGATPEHRIGQVRRLEGW